LLQKLVLRMLSHRENFRQSKYWQKSEEKNRKYFQIWTKGIKEFDLGKKLKTIACVCTFKYIIERYA
jgi:hypothetical protein